MRKFLWLPYLQTSNDLYIKFSPIEAAIGYNVLRGKTIKSRS